MILLVIAFKSVISFLGEYINPIMLDLWSERITIRDRTLHNLIRLIASYGQKREYYPFFVCKKFKCEENTLLNSLLIVNLSVPLKTVNYQRDKKNK